jgi:hypothetical protein
MNLYKYLFYFAVVRYADLGEKDIPKSYGLGIITLLQFFTLIGLGEIVLKLLSINIKLTEYHSLIIGAVIAIGNYIWLLKINGMDKLAKEASTLNEKSMMRLNWLTFIHVMVTLTLIYIAYKLNHPGETSA